jgi:hypothetical protein
MTAREFWIINRHTRACFGPYDAAAALDETRRAPHPEDWVIVTPFAGLKPRRPRRPRREKPTT